MFKLYLKYLSIQFKSELEYKKAFIISLIGQLLSSLFSLIGIYFLFDKFGNIRGFEFEHILICYSISFLGFSLAECFFRGFDEFDKMLSNGKFDVMMLKPRSLIFQVIGNKVEFKKISRIALASAVGIIVLVKNPYLLAFDKIITILLMLIGTIVIYGGLFLVKAAVCFYTTQSLEIMNIFTDGARDLTQYPLSIYKKFILDFFTYVIPLALVNLYPLLYIIGRSDNKLYIAAPLMSIIFLIPCYTFWKIGLKRYKSTGS